MSTPPQVAPPRGPTRGRVAAFFDLDKTIIATSSSAAFSKPFYAGGLITRGDVLRSAYAHLLFMAGNADADQTERMRKHLSELATGWEVSKVQQIVAETVHELIDPYVYAEAVELIAEHHELGHDVVIVSASGAELVEPIATVLGADHVIATQMSVDDGRYTGEIEFYAYGEQKAEAVRELAAARGYDLDRSYAYSDSVTDAPMLSAVGHGFAVNPDRALRRLAIASGWGVLTFTRPVALRSVLRPPTVAVAVGAVLATVTVALLVRRWWVRRRP
ncbi:HAD-IB family hydrolase [Isoptericola sp. NEAU-Y5]|uniref:HAD-IB family hydrolase n=1 Tax=Isoptericola luteus TaxID=2879484 RepID=A0ABS7ZAP4_9MICO|nr:HAD family hydrolase [Isoptericola sp. NEAU-Y5]MCA5892133.1 HAD-IB family hydrolase [Isoptericola sp. NEAU-Y5]